ncbi:hypothetical protein [Streptomyces sp. NBC_01294]|uniref:hypothetical protein n=1 Tax=Streptomyces sp. NBC_01294 TaxID=2903815 RepID=UPI003FA35A76
MWYESLKASGSEDQFQDFAGTTFRKAGELFGVGSPEQSAVLTAWQEVEVPVRGVPTGVARARSLAANGNGGAGRQDGLAALTRQVGELNARMAGMAKDMAALRVQLHDHGGGRWPFDGPQAVGRRHDPRVRGLRTWLQRHFEQQ